MVTIYIPIAALVFLPKQKATAQWIPVGAVLDAPLGVQSGIIVLIETTLKFLHEKEKPFHERIKNVQAFFGKAESVVNGAIRQMRMVHEIVELNQEIGELFSKTVNAINTPLDTDDDGEDDLDFLDKWKHVQILLALSGETLSVFELFTNVIEEDGTVMGDKARITFIEKAYRELRLIRSGMKIQIRRINREIYQFRRNQREVDLFVKLFSEN